MRFSFGAEYKHVRIRPLEKRDIESIRCWRNDSSNTEFLRNIGEITPEMQEKWFESDLCDDSSCTFAIEEIYELKRLVGSVAIYDINDKEAEIGKILVGDKAAKGKKVGFYALLLAMHIGYQKMGIEKYIGEVHESNMPARINDLRAGFIVVGEHPYCEGGVEWDMVLPKDHFYNTHSFANEFIIKSQSDEITVSEEARGNDDLT